MADVEGLCARRTAEQLSRLAAIGPESQSRGADASAQRLRAVFAAPGFSPDDERRGRNVAALLGAELAAESVGLQGRQRNDEALRRVTHSSRVDGRRLAVRHRRDRALLRHRRARARRVGQGGQHRRKDRSPRKYLRSAAPPRVSDAAAAVDRLARQDGCGCAEPRMASVSRAGRDQHAHVRQPAGLRVSRLLRARRLPRQRERIDRRHDDPEGAEDRQSRRRHRRARHRSERRWQRPGHWRHVREGHRSIFSAGERRAAGDLHVRKRADAAAIEVESVSQRAREQSRAGRASLHDARDRRQRAGAVLRRTSTTGTACRRRALPSTTSPTTTSIIRASISSAEETCSCTRIGGRSSPPA